jgi:carbon monoxide dehydrogenase subunit G
MATIRKEIRIAAPPARVWDALRDYGAVHTRVAPGFVVDAKLDGRDRIVTFANGLVSRELLVSMDDAERRLVYSARSERVTHHNASVQVFADGEHTRLVWLADLLPHELVGHVNVMMEQGAAAMQKALAKA